MTQPLLPLDRIRQTTRRRFLQQCGSGMGAMALASLLVAVLVGAPPAAAQFWSNDFSISEGDVNETSTSLNNQRFAAVDDSNNLYITFFDNRNKVDPDDNFEIYFRRFIYNFGSPTITRVTNAPNPSRYPSIANLNWGSTDRKSVV